MEKRSVAAIDLVFFDDMMLMTDVSFSIYERGAAEF